MRFLIDAQLPRALCGWLEERGAEPSQHVGDVLGAMATDQDIAALAAADGLVLISKDSDFVFRHPPIDYQLVWLRCGNITTRRLGLWLAPRWWSITRRLQREDRLIEVG